MTWSVAPTRGYQGNLVVSPTWANWVEASMDAPPPQICSASGPRSMRWIARGGAPGTAPPSARPVVPDVKQTPRAARRPHRRPRTPVRCPPGPPARVPGRPRPAPPRGAQRHAVDGSGPATTRAAAPARLVVRPAAVRPVLTPAGAAPSGPRRPASTSQSPPERRADATTSPGPTPGPRVPGQLVGPDVELGVGEGAGRVDDHRAVAEPAGRPVAIGRARPAA